MANRSLRIQAEYERSNLEAAVIILNDPVQFPPGSGGELWARGFLKRWRADERMRRKREVRRVA